MERSFADLLTDAFSETSLPSFPDGELDFESLYFDEKFEEDTTGSSHKNLTILTEEDEALHQEAMGQSGALSSSLETNDIDKVENHDKQETDTKKDKEEEHCESSDRDPEEIEKEDRGTGEKPEGWSMSVHCGEELWDRDKEDRIFAEGPLAPEGTENPQVRNEEQGESESDEDMYYFGSVPKRGSGMIMQVDGIEDEEQQREEERLEDSTDTEFEGMKIEKDEVKEENLFTRYFPQEDEDHQRDGPIFELPEVLMKNLQDLIADDDSEEDIVDNMKDFSGEDHQEAGESFADYPSDFSSCEYMEDGRKNQESKYKLKVLPCTSDSGSNMKQNTYLERGATEIAWMGSAVDTNEKEDQDLDTGWIGIDDVKIAGLDLANEETDNRRKTEIVKHISGNASVKGCDDGDEISEPMCLDAKGNTYTEEYQYNSDSDTSARRHQSESDTYSSSDDEIQVRSDEESTDNICHQGPENNEPLEDAQPHRENRAALSRGNMSDDLVVTNDCSRGDLAACSVSWDTDITTIEALLSEDLLLSTEDTDKEETLPLDVITAELVPVDIHSVVQLGEDTTIHSSNQGSVDDCFFFNNEYEASRATELGQFGDDEYEEERNWEQEQERIKAFYKFYNDGEGEHGKEGRKIKVQFCTDPLSQVIHYDTDSSDRESLNSSTEGEEDLTSAETSKETNECETPKMNSAPHPTHNLLPEHVPDLSNTQLCTRKHKCLGILKLILKMGLVMLMGLLMLWWATIQLDWLGQVAFF